MYHRFNESKYPSTNIQMEVFKNQIEIIKKSNYSFNNPDNFKKEFDIPKLNKEVLITIDDAFQSFYLEAWPYLKENKIPFILFVSTEPVGRRGYMTWDQIKEVDAEFYAGLEKAGFLLDWGADNSGLFMKYLRRGSGYYIDVGASQLIIDGKIKLKNGQVSKISEEGVIFEDGSVLNSDVIVYATGYGSMNGWVADLIDLETADKVGKVWGLGSDTPKDPGPWEGEQRNMWKPTQQEALWFHGGNLHQSRHYSQFLSLQIKARMEGIDTPVYDLQESYHTGR